MKTDPAMYIYAAALLGGLLGFFSCALCASSRIRRANLEGYLEAVNYQKRMAQLEREG